MNEHLWNIAATALGGFISAFVTFFVLKIENLKKHYVDFCHLLLTATRSITFELHMFSVSLKPYSGPPMP